MIIASDSVSKKHFIEAGKVMTIAPATEEEYLDLCDFKKIEYAEGTIYIQTSSLLVRAVVTGNILMQGMECLQGHPHWEFLGTCFGVKLPTGIYAVPDHVVFPRGIVKTDDLFFEGVPVIVVEVVTEGMRKHLEMKEEWYRKAGVTERWYIDTATRTVTIAKDEGRKSMKTGKIASEKVPEFVIDIDELWDNN